MVEISDEAFKQCTDEIRDIINWIAVFETEYKLPAEVVGKLRSRLEKLATNLGVESM